MMGSAARFFLGLLAPLRNLRLGPADPSGVDFFYRVFPLWGLLPVWLLNLAAKLLEKSHPETWRFGDINPNTVLVVGPVYLITGPLILWLFSHSMRLGLSCFGLRNPRLIPAGWYAGTTLLTLLAWWFGLSIFFVSMVDYRETVNDITGWTLLVTALLALRVVLGAFTTNATEEDDAPSIGIMIKVLVGVVVGVAIYLVAGAAIGFVLRPMLREILSMSLG